MYIEKLQKHNFETFQMKNLKIMTCLKKILSSYVQDWSYFKMTAARAYCSVKIEIFLQTEAVKAPSTTGKILFIQLV